MSNLPIEHLSFSSLRCFLSNPWQFRKEWILGLRDRKISPTFLVGKALHLYAERYYSGVEPTSARREALEAISNGDLSDVDWGKTGSVEKALKDLTIALNHFDLYCSGLTGALGTEISVTTGFEIGGVNAPLPLKAITDLVRKDENGNLVLIDWKTVTTFSESSEEDPLKIMQAIFNYYTCRAKYGQAPVRMDYYQIKKSVPRDNSCPVEVYSVDYSQERYFKFFSRIYTGFIKLVSDDNYCYLPNLADLMTAKDSWQDFTAEILDFSQPKQVSHKSAQDVVVNTAGARRVMAAQAAKEDKDLIADKLLEFGVVSELKSQADCQFGTKYSYTISKGVAVGKLKKLKDDIEFALGAGIELNLTGKQELTVITLSDVREVVKQPTGEEGKLLIGQSIGGEVVTIDLQKDPHALIAGATGAGKSYLMANLIKQVKKWSKTVIIDIKCELAKNAICEDSKVVKKLEKILKAVRAGNVTPQVIFIDELGDLILSKTPVLSSITNNGELEPAGRIIENLLVRICQLGRSQGVHVIAATQRPSIKICTGILKANMPGRVGLRTATSVDSRVIIDEGGCENLIGNGDAYVLSAGTKIRTQCYA